MSANRDMHAYTPAMNILLSAIEARVIGCLIEKQITTPDQYPLSINALVLACNQKSNRDPLMQLPEPEVQKVVDGLVRKHLMLERSGFGSRVPKYQQRFCNTEFSTLQFSEIQRAILCELLVRGAQTPGELRTRGARMAAIGDVSEVEAALEDLATRADGPFVVKLPREPNRRDSRWAHLFCGEVQIPEASVAEESSAVPFYAQTVDADRLDRLENEVRQLREEMAELKRQLGG